MNKKPSDVAALAEKMLALPTTSKLVMASLLIKSGELEIAERVTEAALEDLQSRRLLNTSRAPLMDRKGE
jgi:hypothetical protein